MQYFLFIATGVVDFNRWTWVLIVFLSDIINFFLKYGRQSFKLTYINYWSEINWWYSTLIDWFILWIWIGIGWIQSVCLMFFCLVHDFIKFDDLSHNLILTNGAKSEILKSFFLTTNWFSKIRSFTFHVYSDAYSVWLI